MCTANQDFYTPASEINGNIGPNDRPYSEDLITLLERWEYPAWDDFTISIMQNHIGQDGSEVPNYEYIPTARWVSDVLLSVARRKVRRYRGISKRPRTYFREIDVSWTRPERIMPYE